MVFVPLLNFHLLVLKNRSIYNNKNDQIGFLSLEIVIIKLWIHDYITLCYYYVLQVCKDQFYLSMFLEAHELH